MNNDQTYQDLDADPKGPGLGVTDIYYILFRRKWLIVAGLVLGIVGAGVLWRVKRPLYYSTAELWVRYVKSTEPMMPNGGAQQIRETGSQQSVIPTEVDILTSADVAQGAAALLYAEGLGPLIVPAGWPTNDPGLATGIIGDHLKITTSPQSEMIKIRFEHPNANIASNALTRVIQVYLKKHMRLHTANLSRETFVSHTNELRTRLHLVIKELTALETNLGPFNIDEFKTNKGREESTLKEDLRKAQSDWAELNENLRSSQATIVADSTNATPGVRPAALTMAKRQEYRQIWQLENKVSEEIYALSGMLTTNSPRYKLENDKLEALKKKKEALEKENPELLSELVVPNATVAAGATPPLLSGRDLERQVNAKMAKILFLSNQLSLVKAEIVRVSELRPRIEALTKEKKSLESELSTYETRAAQNKYDAELGSSNIEINSAPSYPIRDFTALYKKLAMVLMGGFGLGLGLAFAMELVFDRTLKRPKDIENYLRLPLLLSVPHLQLEDSAPAHANGGGKAKAAQDHANGLVAGHHSRENGAPPEDEVQSAMKPYHDALRDRLVNYFDVRDMTHKPKMIAVTSCGAEAGVSAIASGLAASLSETGDGNVLLVDMRGEKGAAHAFIQGKPACGLDQALENDSRTSALVTKHLYVVSAETAEAPDQKLRKILPRQFGEYVPRLKASDYDYIIFDMPPVAQTSITSKVARFMDMMLLVVESDGTDREVAARAGALLAESKATVGTILNKRRRYVPAWLLEEFH